MNRKNRRFSSNVCGLQGNSTMETARWGDVRLDAIVAEFGDLIGRRVILIMYLEIIFNIYYIYIYI